MAPIYYVLDSSWTYLHPLGLQGLNLPHSIGLPNSGLPNSDLAETAKLLRRKGLRPLWQIQFATPIATPIATPSLRTC